MHSIFFVRTLEYLVVSICRHLPLKREEKRSDAIITVNLRPMSFPGRALQRAWHLVDASNQTVGRLATVVAPILRGKHKPTYSPHQDVGDYVVIINADKVCRYGIDPPRARALSWCVFVEFLLTLFRSLNYAPACRSAIDRCT